ncbi:MAG: RsmB/NOP family class I SAM-dependent RNA methyltransferase [Deltaproteobacteria bacterium]|nr:MAG: RsmB/NOP family class I SAM-dependent RNA methyltransferase [Deltaproteobacteria bacterium]
MTSRSPEQCFASYRSIILDFADFCEKLRHPLPVHLRINTLKALVTETCLRLTRLGIQWILEDPIDIVLRVRNGVRPGHLREYSLGHLHSQAFSSVLAGLILDPKPASLVLDLCAAPGSKTTLLAQLMRNNGVIVANEKNPTRLIPLRTNLKRLGVTNTISVCYPGQHFPKLLAFDRVLVDVPCSGEGTLRTGPDGTLRWSGQSGSRLPSLQRELLLRAFDLLAPNGILVYSTCTYNPDENESVVQCLLDNRPASIEPISLDIPHAPGLERWQEITYDPSIRLCWRIYPHQLDTVGFFLARVGRAN